MQSNGVNQELINSLIKVCAEKFIIIILKALKETRKKEAIYDELIEFQACPCEILDQMAQYMTHIILSEFISILLSHSIWLLRLIFTYSQLWLTFE